MTLRKISIGLAGLAIVIGAAAAYSSGSWMPLIMAGAIAGVVFAGAAATRR